MKVPTFKTLRHRLAAFNGGGSVGDTARLTVALRASLVLEEVKFGLAVNTRYGYYGEGLVPAVYPVEVGPAYILLTATKVGKVGWEPVGCSWEELEVALNAALRQWLTPTPAKPPEVVRSRMAFNPGARAARARRYHLDQIEGNP